MKDGALVGNTKHARKEGERVSIKKLDSTHDVTDWTPGYQVQSHIPQHY